MGRRSWASKEQLLFLDSKRVEFLRHRKEKTLRAFWDSVHKEWFGRWPIPEPGPAEVAEVVKLGKIDLTGDEDSTRDRLVS